MDQSKDWDDWIQAYLDGELNADEIEAFQAQLAESPIFSLRFKQYQESILQLKAVQLNRLKSDMKSWVADSGSSKPYQPIRPLVWLASAAMAVLLTFMGSWYFFNQYRTEALLSSVMDYKVKDAERNMNTEINGALQALEEQRFESAIQNLPNWVDEDGETTPRAYLYLAKAYIGLGQFDSAAYYLDLLERQYKIRPDEIFFWEEIPWYQALVALGKKDQATALSSLEQVIENGGLYKSEAQELKSKLESSWYQRLN
ncbi:MAG: zf-HC2 domain-containing protein [Bacteroidota bacterium]